MNVCIIGVGFVGESLVNVFSKKFNVYGIDISDARINFLSKKYFDKKNISFSTNIDKISGIHIDLFCISVPTLINEDYNINETNILAVLDMIKKYLHAGTCVVIESSVYVGMTRKIFGHLRNDGVYIGFSPERIDPGRTDPLPEDIPKIISGIDNVSLSQISQMYGSVFSKIIPVSTMETAEMCKLAENCFRMVNIAYANEIDNACKHLGIDTYEMIHACSTKPYGFMPFYPGLGVGGHCIPINPWWLAITSKNDIPLLMNATVVTKNRPIVEAHKLIGSIDEDAVPYTNILVIGLAFKPGESLTTNSAGVAFVNELISSDINVSVYDPLVDKSSFNYFNFLSDINFNTKYIDSTFSHVCIAIKQSNIDWNIIKACNNINIISYCDL